MIAAPDPHAAARRDPADDGVTLIDGSDPGHWSGGGHDLLSAHLGVIDACAGLLEASERRGYEAGRLAGYRDAVSLVRPAVEDLLAGRDLGDLPPSAVRWVAAAIVSRLNARRPAEPLGDRVVEGGLGI
ncbi:MAG TPA: hypothetical protein VF796_04070 [Humisphaera sp.]